MGLVSYKKTIAASTVAQQISTSSFKCHHALIQSDSGNSAAIRVGCSDALASDKTGLVLPIPQANIYYPPLEIRGGELGNDLDLSEVYIEGTAGDVVNVIAFVL